MSTTVRTALVYGIAAVAALVLGLVLDHGLLLLVAGIIVVIGVVHVSRARALEIERARAKDETAVREGNAPPERHGGW